jgi:hypothetical protein
MTKIKDKRSIVAVDPTSRGLAYVFFERGELMDWGHHGSALDEQSGLVALDRLLDGCAADILVLEDPEAPRAKRRPRVKALLQSMANHARRRGIRVVAVSREEVSQAWRRRDATNKEAVAEALGAEFPELEPLVPPRREFTDSEALSTNIFDALALLLHIFGSSSVDDLAA